MISLNYHYNYHKEYHCLISSLGEYTLESDASRLDVRALRGEILRELSSSDAKAVKLLYTYYDIENLLGYIKGTNLPFNRLGNLTNEQIADEVNTIAPWDRDDEAEPFVSKLPDSISLLLDRHKQRIPLNDDGEPIYEGLTLEALEVALYEQFYRLCGTSGSKFMRQWGFIDKNIRNVVAATRARELGMEVDKVMIGDDFREQLTQSQAADFGLKEDLEFIPGLLAVLEVEDFVEREHKMDALRWGIVESLNEQEYFSISVVLGYLIKLNIIYRWVALDKEVGRGRFREIVNTLTEKSKF